MKDSVTPVFQNARSVPLRYKDKIHTELKRLQQLGVIKPKLSSAWASPIVSVLKSNGVVRICGDYANSINKYQALHSSEISLRKLKKGVYFRSVIFFTLASFSIHQAFLRYKISAYLGMKYKLNFITINKILQA